MAQKKYTTAKTAKGKLQTVFLRGQRMAFNGQLDAAVQDFEKALDMDPTFIDAQMEWANVKNQQKKYAEAELGYEKTLALDPAYEPSVLNSLALVEFDQKKYKQAAEHFEQFLNSPAKISESRRAKTEKYLADARFAAEATENPVPYEPKNLGPNINTPGAEYLPTITAQGEALIYTAVRGGQEDFYISQRVNGEWQRGVPIEAVNTSDNEGAQSITADEKYLVFTACNRRDGLGSCDLYFAERINGKMTRHKNLGPPVNTAGWESQPSISSDGKTLFFAADRRGGRGGKDLWVSKRQENGAWSEPKNLGPPVNTAGDEQSPFIHADGQTLYFMSNGLPGMGGFDLYLSRLQADGSWGKPQNLGYPINSEGNEGALSVSLDGRTAYFATDILNVKAGESAFDNPQGKGTTDIYSFELPEIDRPYPVTYVKATVTDAFTGKPLVAKVTFTDLATGLAFATATTEADGAFLITLPAGKNYALHVSKEKYLFQSENFALSDEAALDKPFLLDIALEPITPTGTTGNDLSKAKPVVLKNVFFETGSANLKKESLGELESLKILLEENPALHIQINGHTDNVGTDEDNLTLSTARAKAVFDYLVEKGISSSRLKYQGFGEDRPIAANETEAGRQQNRRTEFEITRQ
ncbi:MAG: PD40 domain-containing protein [Lewinellaceae bacterium]|nr:PD40 domain-containing protein [Saprospiraceae bacterium]MCB9336947.1 PD40 domain-containing protein [Lewinellaceae bacterium]